MTVQFEESELYLTRISSLISPSKQQLQSKLQGKGWAISIHHVRSEVLCSAINLYSVCSAHIFTAYHPDSLAAIDC